MTTEFTIVGDALRIEGWSTPRSVILADLRTLLISWGHDEWDVDEALERVTLHRAYWSDIYGGVVHDCSQHSPEEWSAETCFPDARRVVFVVGLPPRWLGVEDLAPALN